MKVKSITYNQFQFFLIMKISFTMLNLSIRKLSVKFFSLGILPSGLSVKSKNERIASF